MLRERDVEKILVQGIRAAGGRAYKFVSPGNNGVPDRIAVLPGGRIMFIELKADDGKLSRAQERQVRILDRLGCDVCVLYGAEDVRKFLAMLAEWLSPSPDSLVLGFLSGRLADGEEEE